MKRKLVTVSETNELPQSIKLPQGSLFEREISERVVNEFPLVHKFSNDYNQIRHNWLGKDWVKRDSSWKSGGPQANDSWDESLSSFANEKLVLRTSAEPSGSEVVSVDSLGYGEYHFRVVGNFNSFGANTVFGAFLFEWEEDSVPGYREIDLIEISRWGGTNLVGKFTIYPTETGMSTPDYVWPVNLTDVSIKLVWEPNLVSWSMTNTTDGSVIYNQSLTGKRVPKANNQQFHFNLWHFNGEGWESEPPQSVTVSEFSYTPSNPLIYFPDSVDRIISEKLLENNSLTNTALPKATSTHINSSSGAVDIFKTRALIEDTNLLVVAGSNSVFGTGVSSQDRWISRLGFGEVVEGYDNSLSKVYSAGKYTLNVSVDNSNSGNYLNSTKAGALGGLNPSLVIHLVGENDSTYTWGSPDFVSNNIEDIIKSIDYTSSKPVGHLLVHGHERLDENLDHNWKDYLRVYRDLAIKYPNVSVLDLSNTFRLLVKPSSDPLNLLVSRRNLSSIGHKIYADMISSAIM